jgi:predicted dienelactone hydrolase
MKFLIKFSLSCLLIFLPSTGIASHTGLLKPTGQYHIGFKDVHWINYNACPDFNFNEKNKKDFSRINTNCCHEIMARIYYPTRKLSNSGSLYYQPFIKSKKEEILNTIPDIDPKKINELDSIHSYSIHNASIVPGKFPTLLFSPGFGYPAQAYENTITELVSHGYIVIGINTPFINPVALANSHIIEAASDFTEEEFERQFVPLQAQDLLFTFNKIYELHHKSALFSHIDLSKIGLLGHSIGARILADVAHEHPDYFKAAATLDIGFDETGNSLKQFGIPFMHIIAADRRTSPPGVNAPPIIFELAKNNFLTGIAKNEDDHQYSSHDNFSDVSTLQYLPALQAQSQYRKQCYENGFTLQLRSTQLSDAEIKKLENTTYILIKYNNLWHLSVYEKSRKTKDIDVTMVAELPEALSELPMKPPEQFTNSEIKSVQETIASLHYILYGKSFLGTGNGKEIANTINSYLLEFFDTYLKGNKNNSFANCVALSEDSYMKCGPGNF